MGDSGDRCYKCVSFDENTAQKSFETFLKWPFQILQSSKWTVFDQINSYLLSLFSSFMKTPHPYTQPITDQLYYTDSQSQFSAWLADKFDQL